MDWAGVMKFKDITQEWRGQILTRLMGTCGGYSADLGTMRVVVQIPVQQELIMARGTSCFALCTCLLIFPVETGLVTHSPQVLGRGSLIHGKYL